MCVLVDMIGPRSLRGIGIWHVLFSVLMHGKHDPMCLSYALLLHHIFTVVSCCHYTWRLVQLQICMASSMSDA